MKHLQKNNPTIGAQEFPLADMAGEDIYIYRENKSLISNLTNVMAWVWYNNRRIGTTFQDSEEDNGVRVWQDTEISEAIYTARGPASLKTPIPIDLYKPFYFGIINGETKIPLVKFYNFNEDNFHYGNHPKIEMEEMYAPNIKIYNGRNLSDYNIKSYGLDNDNTYTDIGRVSNTQFSIELTFKSKPK